MQYNMGTDVSFLK